MKKWFISICIIFLFFTLKTEEVHGEQVLIIDGSFGDWEGIEHVDISNSSNVFSQAAMVYDEQFIYIHVKEEKSGQWATNYPTIKMVCNGTSKDIVIVRNDYSGNDGIFDLSIKNSWYANISNTEAKVLRKQGYNEWEIKMPIYDIFISNSNQTSNNVKTIVVESLNASWSQGGAVSLSGAYIGDEIPPIPDPGEEPGLSGIIIDGYFDDWENMPITEIGYGPSNMNQASLVKDDHYIYLYYEMNANNNWMPLDGINLSVNGNTCQIFIRYAKEDGTIDWSRDVYHLSEGIYPELSSFTYSYNNRLGATAVSIGHNNRLELRVDIATLETALGLTQGTINSGATISVTLPSLGSGKLEAQEVSTGTFAWILISIGTAFSLFWYQRKRKSQRCRESRGWN